MGPVE